MYPVGVLAGFAKRYLLGKTARCFGQAACLIRGDGLEIGGPSKIFQADGALPVYRVVNSVRQIQFLRPSQGVILENEGSSYDFVLSSHMIEHCANPLLALKEWRRVLKTDGALLLVLPDASKTFDHKRPVTTFTHLVEDLSKGESDLTHVEEALALQDRTHWTFPRNDNDWESLYRRNLETRQLHHHVFDMNLACSAVAYAGFHIEVTEHVHPFHLVILASCNTHQ